MKLVIRKSTSSKAANRMKKKVRIRKVVTGTGERPRLSVFKSLKHIYAQLIDDVTGVTLLSTSTLNNTGAKEKAGKEAAAFVGQDIAKKAISKNISTIVFDRNGYIYHGRVKALADAAREAGLKF